jgi:hypothetical protein
MKLTILDSIGKPLARNDAEASDVCSDAELLLGMCLDRLKALHCEAEEAQLAGGKPLDVAAALLQATGLLEMAGQLYHEGIKRYQAATDCRKVGAHIEGAEPQHLSPEACKALARAVVSVLDDEGKRRLMDVLEARAT